MGMLSLRHRYTRHTHTCVHMASEDPEAFKSLPHPRLSEPSASALPGFAPQGHQQPLVNDNPNVYIALGRCDREQAGRGAPGQLQRLLGFLTSQGQLLQSGVAHQLSSCVMLDK